MGSGTSTLRPVPFAWPAVSNPSQRPGRLASPPGLPAPAGLRNRIEVTFSGSDGVRSGPWKGQLRVMGSRQSSYVLGRKIGGDSLGEIQLL